MLSFFIAFVFRRRFYCIEAHQYVIKHNHFDSAWNYLNNDSLVLSTSTGTKFEIKSEISKDGRKVIIF